MKTLQNIISWLIAVAFGALAYYNGYSVTDWAQWATNEQICMALLCLLALLRPKGLLWWVAVFFFISLLIEAIDEAKGHNTSINLSDYVSPWMVAIAVAIAATVHYKLKRK